MSRLTIRIRLIILSGALLCMLVATNLYLTRKLANDSTAVATETELSGVIESANSARIAFGEMRYWLTDLAVSLLTVSERNAAAARGRMDGYLDQLAPRKPKLVAAVRAERDEHNVARGALAPRRAEGREQSGDRCGFGASVRRLCGLHDRQRSRTELSASILYPPAAQSRGQRLKIPYSASASLPPALRNFCGSIASPSMRVS